MTHPIVLDCDPGHDDAVAILLAAGSPEIELLAVTTVVGNQTLEKTTYNARAVCTAAGITNMPVAAGCAQPLVRAFKPTAAVHGESGLDGVDVPEPGVSLVDEHAVDLIIDTVMAREHVTLVPVGPLTNIAMALRKEPRIARRVREVVLMGGAYTRGNVTPAAEFNISVDPEAAALVFDAGWPVTMVGLDLTHQALATSDVIARLATVDTPGARLTVQTLEAYGKGYRPLGLPDPPLHDPCAVARVIAPELVRCQGAHVGVETRGRLTSGMTVTSFDVPPLNAQVATTLDSEGFWKTLVEALTRLPG
ncbi:MAG: nucleoside hydrolase [Streptosporangiaceae bacterium]